MLTQSPKSTWGWIALGFAISGALASRHVEHLKSSIASTICGGHWTCWQNEAFECRGVPCSCVPWLSTAALRESGQAFLANVYRRPNQSPPGSPDEPSQLHTSWTATFSHPEWCQLHRSIGCITQLNDIYAGKNLNCFGYRPKTYLKLTLVEKYCCQVSKNPRTVA